MMNSIVRKVVLVLILAIPTVEAYGQDAVSEEGISNVTFAGDVLPLLELKCNTGDCHGRQGSAFPKLTTYLMVRAKSKLIMKRMNNTRDPMPPLESEERLTAAEIQLFQQWIDQGTPKESPEQ